jgi:hypothetical protein
MDSSARPHLSANAASAMESERCDTGGLPSLDLPADAPLIVQCFKGSDGESCELRPSTLASTALLQHVLEAGTRPRHSQGSPSQLSQICFSDRPIAPLQLWCAQFLLTPDASTWVVWMTRGYGSDVRSARQRASAAAYSSADQNSCKGTDRAAADLVRHVPAHTESHDRAQQLASFLSRTVHKPCSSESTSCATQPASFLPTRSARQCDPSHAVRCAWACPCASLGWWSYREGRLPWCP